jgi:hypothetical protein
VIDVEYIAALPAQKKKHQLLMSGLAAFPCPSGSRVVKRCILTTVFKSTASRPALNHSLNPSR